MKHWIILFLLAFTGVSAAGQTQKAQKVWTLVQKQGGQERKFAEGDKITLKWQSTSGMKTTRGALKDISTDSTTLMVKHNPVRIGNQDIAEIVTKRETAWSWLAGVLTIIGGVVVAGFFILGQIILTINRTDRQLASNEQYYLWPWSLLGIGLIIWGSLSLKDTIRTKQPFDKAWDLQEIPAPNNKAP